MSIPWRSLIHLRLPGIKILFSRKDAKPLFISCRDEEKNSFKKVNRLEKAMNKIKVGVQHLEPTLILFIIVNSFELQKEILWID